MASHAQELHDLRDRINDVVESEIARCAQTLAPVGHETQPLLDSVATLMRGGKRLRATFLYEGYRAAGGANTEAALRAATAMEFFQAGALLHDDLMDDSDTRRGAPSAHRRFAAIHRNQHWPGDSHRFGLSGAILAGDLCLVWCDNLFTASGWSPEESTRARTEFDAMRSQLMAGQFLEMLLSTQGWEQLSTDERVAQAARVIRYKSAKYSVEQPLLIGAHAAGADTDDLRALSRYGLDVGEAFQLRDDLLGVFGDPTATGKPAGDDIREGKLTIWMAYALDTVSGRQKQLLTSALGDADLSASTVADLHDILRTTGAVQRVEDRIELLTTVARKHLRATSHLTSEGVDRLSHLIDVATSRSV